jgi:hypothetical protein
MTKWPTVTEPATATIAPTGYGTFGVWWTNFEAMERRGGYSGPYRSAEEATDGVAAWCDQFDIEQNAIRIVHSENVQNRDSVG